MESKREKFKRLAEKRTNEVLSRIKILGNLSNRSSYEYSSEEIEKIIRAIENQIRQTKARFYNSRVKKFQL